jgi:hypothetical protein
LSVSSALRHNTLHSRQFDAHFSDMYI